jgi:acylphosphatase
MHKVSFEVFGRVQGVNFRAYTAKNAKQLGLRGWCMNTKQGTVAGELEGAQVRCRQLVSEVCSTVLPYPILLVAAQCPGSKRINS